MSQEHLAELESAIERAGWTVAEKNNVQENHISAIWQIRRKWNETVLTLEFHGANDLSTLPIEESYACSVVGHPGGECYFARKGRTWPSEVAAFEAFLSRFA